MARRSYVAATLNPLPRALLLDLDDTILSFEAAAEPAWRQVCDAHAPAVADPRHTGCSTPSRTRATPSGQIRSAIAGDDST